MIVPSIGSHDLEMKMTTIAGGLRKAGGAVSRVAVVLALTAGIAVAADIPLVDGTHWVKSTAEVKKAYLVGVSNVIQLEVAYLADNPLPWPQIYEEGGLDSRPANQLGILTLPTMLLVDAEGKVVNRNIQIGDVENEVKKLVR